MKPFALDVVQLVLDGGNTYAIAHGKFLDGLLLLQIDITQFLLAHIGSCPELVAAVFTFVQLYALAYGILYRMGRPVYLLFILTLLWAFEMPAKLAVIINRELSHPTK